MISREDREQIVSIWILDVLESEPRVNGSERFIMELKKEPCMYIGRA